MSLELDPALVERLLDEADRLNSPYCDEATLLKDDLPPPLEDGHILLRVTDDSRWLLGVRRFKCSHQEEGSDRIVPCPRNAWPGYLFCKRHLVPSASRKRVRCAFYWTSGRRSGEQCPLWAAGGTNFCPAHAKVKRQLRSSVPDLVSAVPASGIFQGFVPEDIREKIGFILGSESPVALSTAEEEIKLAVAIIALHVSGETRCPGKIQTVEGEVRCNHSTPAIKSREVQQSLVKMLNIISVMKDRHAKLSESGELIPRDVHEARMEQLIGVFLTVMSQEDEIQAVRRRLAQIQESWQPSKGRKGKPLALAQKNGR